MKPKVTTRTVNAVLIPNGEIHVEWPEGHNTIALAPADVLKVVRACDKKLAKSGVLVATVVNWFGFPDDFEMPK